MTPLLLAFAAFAGFSLIGLALLALVRADTAELRIVLSAPALGSCTTVLGAFPFSEAGVPIDRCAIPLVCVLLVGSAAVIAVRRPPVHRGAVAVALACMGGLLLMAWPMFSLGYRWLANGNDDMANYVLSAQDLMQHGLLQRLDITGILQGRDYASVLTSTHVAGARPGSDMLLAVFSRVSGRPPYEMFMPLICALNLCGACAVGALALQTARRWWVGLLATVLVLVFPLATFGALQQLIAQVWGLGLVAALFALLMRPEIHGGNGRRARLGEIVPIGMIAGGLVLVYVELIPTMGIAYLCYLGVMARGRRLRAGAVLRLWLPAVAIVIVLLNAYFFTELSFLRGQVTHGVSGASFPPLFGYIFVPSALPGVVGLQLLPPGAGAPLLDLTIALAIVLIAGAIAASLLSARRGSAAAIVLLVEAALGILLAVKNSDFGLFKLAMYIQPFLAAALAVWLSRARGRLLGALAAVATVALVAAQLSTQHAYVAASREAINVPHLSAADVIPRFHTIADESHGPIVAVTENPVLIKLEAAAAAGHSVYFQSRDVFHGFFREYDERVGGADRAAGERLLSQVSAAHSFNLHSGAPAANRFEVEPASSLALSAPGCRLVLPSTTGVPFNGLTLAAGAGDLVSVPCTAPRDLLAFATSNLGQSFYLPTSRRSISFFQPQPDPYFTGRTMTGFGRYAMFQVLGYLPGARLSIEITDTLDGDGANRLPPATVIGATRAPLGLLGRGSGRVFSSAVTPQWIGGVPYVMLDMGRDGRLADAARSGLQGLYGGSVRTDPNYRTAFVRDISLVSAPQYAAIKPPSALASFPQALENRNLEYSGIYEDGWMGADGFVRLAGGPAARLVLRADVPAGAGGVLRLMVDGRQVFSGAAVPGPLEVGANVPASRRSRRVELHFSSTVKLAAPDLRPAAARLRFLGLTPAPTR